MKDSVKKVMKDRFLDVLKEHLGDKYLSSYPGLIHKLVTDLVVEAFSVCGIPEKEQEEEW